MNQSDHALADQIIAAYGGTQHIAQEGSKAYSGEATLYCSAQFGKRNSHQTRSVTLHWQGSNIRMELVGGERTVALGRNGRGWIQLGDKVFPSEDAGPPMISRQLECLPMFLRRLAGSPANLHPEGYARIGQEWFDVASLSDIKNGPTYVVLDRTSHLIRRMFGRAIPDTAYDDYRMVGGAVAPFKYAQAEPLEPTALMPGEKLPSSSVNRTVFRNNRSIERPILAFAGISETESLPETTPPLPTSSVPIVTPITYKQGRLLIAGTINGARAYFAVSNEPFTTVDPAIANATSTVDITLGTASIKLSKPHLKEFVHYLSCTSAGCTSGSAGPRFFPKLFARVQFAQALINPFPKHQCDLHRTGYDSHRINA